ncbi:T9SS type A sorting domain-containing protein [uncultured Aquimarina sp.]|uniref:T9SS type A sorting domain-containing protein n=1 Tax=uncultured Aquimarina sp. TaxID=575652 RepID=UPI002610E83E|nr:T9SS type A sorting domain-containing protein [uncultured Aquimarina sp.]
MKNTTYYILIVSLLCCVFTTSAQGYTFTLLDNGSYSYTVAAVSNFDSGSFSPLANSYGFTIELPDGVDLTVTEALPSGATETVTFVDGSNLNGLSGVDADVSNFDYYFINTDIAGIGIGAHTDAQPINLLTFTVNGDPASGEVRLVDNESSPASSSALNGALDSFFQVDTDDDGSVSFENRYLGQSGDNNHGFNLLSNLDITFQVIDVYPNPTTDKLYITNNVEQVVVYNTIGQKVLTTANNEVEMASLPNGMYSVHIFTEKGVDVKQILKK